MSSPSLSSGTYVYAANTAPPTYDYSLSTGFPSLTWAIIGELESIGEIASSANVTTFSSLKYGVIRKYKGATNYGAMSIVVGRLLSDAGQVMLLEGFDGATRYTQHSFKIVSSDSTTLYFTGKIVSHSNQINDANAVTKTLINVELYNPIVNDEMDLAAILAIPDLAGYWSADPAYIFEDSGATTLASVDGVVGCWNSLGTPAIQATTAVKPYLRKTSTSNIYWLDSNTATSALTATLGNLGSSCTVARAGAEGVTFTEGVTISSTYNIAPAFGFNGDIAIFNRALTATEKALLTRYMQRGVPLLGANLVTNGTFDTDTTGWTAINASLAAVDGRLVATNSANGSTSVSQIIATSGSMQILFSVDFYAETVTGNLFVDAFTQPANVYIVSLNTSAALGTKQVCFQAQTATTRLSTGSSSAALTGQTFTIDNVVARPII